MQEFFSNIIILVFLIIYWYSVLFVLCPFIIDVYFQITSYRLSDIFISTKRNNKIHQGIGNAGRKAIRKHRKKYKHKSLRKKIYGMAKFVNEQANSALSKLYIGTTYITCTHKGIKKIIEKGQEQEYLKIHNIKEVKKKYIILESLAILGVKDTFMVLFSKKHRCTLCKQFYQIKFSRIK